MLSINLPMAGGLHRLRNLLTIAKTPKFLSPHKFWWKINSQFFLLFTNTKLDSGLKVPTSQCIVRKFFPGIRLAEIY